MRTFASVRRHRNYRIYFCGQAVSFTGTWMQQVAASWLILKLTHSPVAVGALALCQLLPVTLFGLFAGTLVDRLNVWRTTIVTESLSLLVAATLAGLTLGGLVRVWEIYLLTGLYGLVLVVDNPARHSLTFQMVGREDVANAVALNSSLGTTARVLGPGIGGLVIATAGPGAAFAVNAGSFLGILVALLSVRPSELVQPERRAEPVTLLRGSREAFAFLRRSPVAAVAVGVVLLVSTFSFNYNVLLPVLAERTLHRGPGTFGLVAAIFGAGALVGALLVATLARASLRLLLVGAAGFGALELAIAPVRSLALVCVLLFATGVFYIFWGANALSSLQTVAPDHLRGRMIAFYFFAFQGGAPFGGLVAGWLSSVGGTRLAFLVAGFVAVGSALAGGGVFARTQGLGVRHGLRARPVGRSRYR